MKTKYILLSLVAAFAVASPQPVIAQEEYEGDPAYDCPEYPEVTISEPKRSATVGRSFSLTGIVNNSAPVTYLSVEVDNQYYVFPQNRNYDYNDPNAEYFTPTVDAQGRFSMTIDLNGKNVVEDYIDGEVVRRGVSDGVRKVEIYAYPDYGEDFDHENCYFQSIAQVGVTVKSSAPDTFAQNESSFVQREKKEIVPSPTPSPSVTPLPSETPEPEASTDFWDILPSWGWVLVGGAVGGAFVGLAENSWIRYRRKHKK